MEGKIKLIFSSILEAPGFKFPN
ncbi:hypothetical protein Zm00014a_043353 [Zea mays]|uniref:Uncharacterized protein n=1 Tax=Zea mays TaxID=4577 RepID=A0A3L6DK59_MAIZE|nr:hypothetical protein Zm00014a_043353 [Zea mays]